MSYNFPDVPVGKLSNLPVVPNTNVSQLANLPVVPNPSIQDIDIIKNRREYLIKEYNALLYKIYLQMLKTCPTNSTISEMNTDLKRISSDIKTIDTNLSKGGKRRKCIYKTRKCKNKKK